MPAASTRSRLAQNFLPWQLLTYGFIHDPDNISHVLFNMLALTMFGAPLEYTWGNRRFLTYYLVCVVGAGLCQLFVASWMAQGGRLIRPSAHRAACSDCCSPTACCSRTSA